MHPRLYMQSFQYATYNRAYEKVTFETRFASGRRNYFSLTKHQFLALNDVIYLIDKGKAHGHFPLGQRTWMHCNAFDASLYRDMKNCDRIYFNFNSFAEYMKHTHQRLLSLVRSKEKKANGVTNVKQLRKIGRGGEAEVIATSCKRPLSVVLQPSDQSPTSKRSRREEWKSTSRSSDHADVSATSQESDLFPKWYYSNSRRRSDSTSSVLSTEENLGTPETIDMCSSGSRSDALESE